MKFRNKSLILVPLMMAISIQANADVNKADAINIASNFVKWRFNNKTITKYEVKEIKSLSDITVAYEISLFNGEKPTGFGACK